MAANIYDWSVIAANNSNSDSDMTWAEGQAPSTVNNSARVVVQRVKQLLVDIGGSIAAGGTANGLTVTANAAFTAYADGQILSFRATASNSAAATLNVNGIGAKAIRKMDSTGEVALAGGEILNTGIYVVQYSAAMNGAAGAWLLLNPTPSNLVLLGLTLTSTDAGATVGPVFTLYRNSASPAAADVLGVLNFDGKDSAANQQTYGNIFATITDPTSTSEDATITHQLVVAGTLTNRIVLTAAGATISGVITFTG